VPALSPLHRAARRLAVGACLLAAAAGGAFAQPAHSIDHERLADRAVHRGKVRVIVGLNVPALLDRLLPAAQMLQQRQSIRHAQNSAALQVLMGTAAQVKVQFETVPYMAIEVDPTALARLRASPLVKEIHEDRLSRPHLLQSTPLVGANTAWNGGRTGTGWSVAVLDTGVDGTHPFLSGKIVSEACFSTTSATDGTQSLCPGGAPSSTAAGSGAPCGGGLCNHGTHVAGVVAGGLAADGSSGVAKGAGIIAIQIYSLFPNYYGPGQGAVLSYESDQVKALERVYALSSQPSMKIAAVNMSLGSGKYTETCDASFPALKTAIDNLRAAGIPTIVAAGNSGYRDGVSGPACISTAVSVGATCDFANTSSCATGQNGVASFSNIASFISLVAPGSSITSAIPGGGYAAMDGTSQAAPHVAGAWALLKQAQPTLSVADALLQLQANGVSMNDTRSSGTVTGLRRLNVAFLGSAGTTYALRVTKLGAAPASGTVTSSVGGINCGSTCLAPIASGTSVTLTASAQSGHTFAGWGGACSGTASTCAVSMTAVRTVTASFNPNQAGLSVTADRGSSTASGTVTSSPTGLSCSTPTTGATRTCSSNFGFNATVTLTAAPAAGSTFSGWSGACTGTTATCTVTMNAARSVTASFSLAPQSLTVTTSRGSTTASGSVSSNPSGLACSTPTTAGVASSSCSANFTTGTGVTLTATAASGSAFTGWSGACTGTATTCSLTMSAARNVTASFAPVTTFALTVNSTKSDANAAGRVTSSAGSLSCSTPTATGVTTAACNASFASGTSVTLTAAPSTGSTFTGWTGACTGSAATCTVAMSAARSVTATFASGAPPSSATLTVNAAKATGATTAAGTVTSAPAGVSCTTPTVAGATQSTCTASYATSASVKLTAAPASGSTFTGWSGSCTGTAATCTVSMSAARTVTATFSVPSYALNLTMAKTRSAASGTVTSSPTGVSCATNTSGTASKTCTTSFLGGTSVTLSAKAASGTTFGGWTGACRGTALTCTVSMTAARDVTATFK
jgi:uncharacterized repeat protein (TIGR02543 family)